MYEIVGFIGFVLGNIARFWWLWLVLGFFIPPFFILALVGFVLWIVSAPYVHREEEPKLSAHIRKLSLVDDDQLDKK